MEEDEEEEASGDKIMARAAISSPSPVARWSSPAAVSSPSRGPSSEFSHGSTGPTAARGR